MPDLSPEFTKQMAKDRLATRIHRSSERMNNPNEEDGSKNKTANQAGVSKSNSHDVTLVDVSRNLTGLYMCEVSAGKPSYHTMIKRARMEVVGRRYRETCCKGVGYNPSQIQASHGHPARLAGCRPGVELAVACAKRRNYYASDAPKTDPAIDIEKERIAVGEWLRANCTTGNSSPASAITWKLNGNLVREGYPFTRQEEGVNGFLEGFVETWGVNSVLRG
ncbi:hypothetical protein K0M31_009142 [Melipona bicolor]|uniref:Ig-like domain-containing protein n=1 Tax=Melipona bicolor TaxID=60889 RepID=A0AA40FNZ5_9HYME|nr:hypothetical protein K0M31_009142 [Melipona bicolor]